MDSAYKKAMASTLKDQVYLAYHQHGGIRDCKWLTNYFLEHVDVQKENLVRLIVEILFAEKHFRYPKMLVDRMAWLDGLSDEHLCVWYAIAQANDNLFMDDRLGFGVRPANLKECLKVQVRIRARLLLKKAQVVVVPCTGYMGVISNLVGVVK